MYKNSFRKAIRGPNPSRDKKFYFPVSSGPALRPTHPPPVQCLSGLFPGVKREVDHSHPPGAEVKNECSYVCTPPICLNGVGRDKVTVRSQ